MTTGSHATLPAAPDGGEPGGPGSGGHGSGGAGSGGHGLAGRLDRLWGPARWALLAVLVLSFATVLLRIVPGGGSTAALARDIEAGRTHSVRVDDQGSDGITVRWSAGPLTERQYTYRPANPFPGGRAGVVGEFTADIRRQAGPAADGLAVRSFDSSYGAGGLTLLVPTAYVLLTPWAWLRVAALLAGLLVVLRTLAVTRHRRASGPAWLLACVVTGAGFFGYLWAEPGGGPGTGPGTGPGSSADGSVRQPRWTRAWLASLVSAAGLAVLGALLLLVAGRY
ncbi:hypothetical protein [Streptomyces sp. CBMA29]|uniref:hypothetical protein n=1 Tax=Streptomyces sp. CBMA29 TaxID=1896314 RepID=UPI001661B054|nr:hypothetical protein [Streptomyces sp. CBMA29]MBD0734169.1 hypothetical protein [Streptomyces sp. CBMA29]